jgi:hypothetical protein
MSTKEYVDSRLLKYPGLEFRRFSDRFVYGSFPHEPVGFGRPISWDRPAGSVGVYYTAQANAWCLFRLREAADKLPDWKIVLMKPLAAISYIASGGFRGPSLYPPLLFPVLRVFDRIADLLPALFATRFLVVLERL